MTDEERAILTKLVTDGLFIDGAHHKQWFLERIAVQFELWIEEAEWAVPGIAP
jgi:hypothetical protein